MKPLTARLDDGHSSITVANHELITIIRLVAKSYTHLWKFFTNRLYLVIHAYKIFFSEKDYCRNQTLLSYRTEGGEAGEPLVYGQPYGGVPYGRFSDRSIFSYFTKFFVVFWLQEIFSTKKFWEKKTENFDEKNFREKNLRKKFKMENQRKKLESRNFFKKK